MKIAIISGSNRKNSQSSKIAAIVSENLDKKLIPNDTIDLSRIKFPFWEDEEDGKISIHTTKFSETSKMLDKSSGIIFVVPEWGGMVPPQVKNIFLLASKNELAHKPGLIITLSASTGGAYPVAELRSFSYKNTKICWIPDHLIIRNVEKFDGYNNERISSRIDYSCMMLLEYAKALKPIRLKANFSSFKNGM